MNHNLKILAGIILIAAIIISIITSNSRLKDEENQLKEKPCYTDCIDMKMNKRSKGGHYIEYTYLVENKKYTSTENYNSTNIKFDQNLHLRVVYACDNPSISKLLLPKRR